MRHHISPLINLILFEELSTIISAVLPSRISFITIIIENGPKETPYRQTIHRGGTATG